MTARKRSLKICIYKITFFQTKRAKLWWNSVQQDSRRLSNALFNWFALCGNSTKWKVPPFLCVSLWNESESISVQKPNATTWIFISGPASNSEDPTTNNPFNLLPQNHLQKPVLLPSVTKMIWHGISLNWGVDWIYSIANFSAWSVSVLSFNLDIRY